MNISLLLQLRNVWGSSLKNWTLLICGWLVISSPNLSNSNSFNADAGGAAPRADIFLILINSLVQTIDCKIKLKRQIFSNVPIFILSFQVYLIGKDMSLFGENIEDDAVKFNNFRVSFQRFWNAQKIIFSRSGVRHWNAHIHVSHCLPWGANCQ